MLAGLPVVRTILRVVALVATWAICNCSFADEFSSFVADAPAGSLAKSLQDSTPGNHPANGVTIRREVKKLAVPGCVLVTSTMINTNETPVGTDDISLAEWTFQCAGAADAARYQSLTYRNDTWYGSTFWTGPDWTRVGKDWHHSGSRTSSIRRFVVPRDGQIRISGRVYKADTNGGDGVRLEIRLGARTVWNAEIEGADATGVEPQLELSVRRGQAIRFVVHRRGTIGFDTTHWDPVLTYVNGPAYRASQGFSTKRQGESGWHYEMERDATDNTSGGWPTIHGFHREFLLFDRSLQPDRPTSFTSNETLPIWIIADNVDKSGIAIALQGNASWNLDCTCTDDDRIKVRLVSGKDQPHVQPDPGGSIRLPEIILVAYQGTWLNGLQRVQRVLDADDSSGRLSQLRAVIDGAGHRAKIASNDNPHPALDLAAMVQLDWMRQDELQDIVPSYSRSVIHQLGRARQLLNDLQGECAGSFYATAASELTSLLGKTTSENLSVNQWRQLYVQARALKRRIALANPLMKFGPMVFCKRVPTSYSHLVMQYYGWRARPGGGLFVLDRPGYSFSCRDILGGKLAGGSILEPRLSYDGKRIVFSYVTCRNDQSTWDAATIENDVDEGFYHVWTVNVDGTNLRQLTSGPYDDLMPCWLPDGGIAFSSTRRRGYARCFGGQFSRRWHVYTLHRMQSDGTSLRLLSAHDTNEWFPTVSNTGHLLYSRWDYIDRDAVTHQNLWAMRPDGTNPIAVWGNATSSPHCMFQAQPIPGSGKIVFTASAHHSITAGAIAMVDPAIGDNGHQAMTRLTPEIPFPEAESRTIPEYYAAPWPLSEEYFLVAYSPTSLAWEPAANARNALGIYLLDRFGNRELIYRDPEIGSTNPCPLSPRSRPPVISSLLAAAAPPTGEMVLTDVYQGLGDIPRGSIKALRIIQIFPKTTNVADVPRIGLAREENARAILGTVPVEPDGSARFQVPAMKPILFQALDEDGFAYQTMRTVTYLQPGERVACSGCHENRRATPHNRAVLALHRPSSTINAGPLGGRPFSFVDIVQPILDQHCVSCHGGANCEGDLDLTGQPRDGFTASYWALCGDRDFWGAGTNPKNAAEALVPRFGGRNQVQVTPPGGQYGARGSRLIRILREGHHEVHLSKEDMAKLAAWIDCNAVFYGAYDPARQAKQLRGERIPMPEIQ